MKRPALLLLALAASSAGAYAPPMPGSDSLKDPAMEARVERIGRQLRCAVCQGMSIWESGSAMARSQLDKTRELVSKGWSDQQIYDYFVGLYGEWILLQPRAHGMNWLVWLGPVLLLMIGGFVVLSQVMKGAVKPAAPPGPPVPGKPDEYLAAIRSELDR